MTFADGSLGMTAWYANSRRRPCTSTCISMRCRSENSSKQSAARRAPHALALVHERRDHGRRSRGGDRQWRVEDAGEELSSPRRRNYRPSRPVLVTAPRRHAMAFPPPLRRAAVRASRGSREQKVLRAELKLRVEQPARHRAARIVAPYDVARTVVVEVVDCSDT